MRRLFLIGCLILIAFASAETQTPVTGRWRAVLLTPGGGTQNIWLELDARGETVTGTIEGLAIREGRVDGSTLTLKLAPNNQEISLTGQVSGDEIVFKSTGLPPVKGSNDDWMNPHDPDAKITKMNDGRTHLAHKAQHAGCRASITSLSVRSSRRAPYTGREVWQSGGGSERTTVFSLATLSYASVWRLIGYTVRLFKLRRLTKIRPSHASSTTGGN
jgi:hypothetical protein